MQKVVLVATGGTISTIRDVKSRELLGRWTGEELVAAIPQARDICEVEVIQFDNVVSMDITPRRMLEIATLLRERLADHSIVGAVVTHGTDTLEETAFMLDLLIDAPKPVVVTGAMRGGGLLGTDGPRNLQASLLVAANPSSAGKGTLVVLNDEIHAASLVSKTHSLNPATFRSPGAGPLGEIWNDQVVYHFEGVRRRPIPATALSENVDLIKVGAGMDGRYPRASIAAGAAGIAVEAAGAGALPDELGKALREAAEGGMVIGITTRCAYGGPAGYVTGQVPNVYFFAHLNGQKVRLLLMAALGFAQGDRATLEMVLANR
jgi:L-asparaginase